MKKVIYTSNNDYFNFESKIRLEIIKVKKTLCKMAFKLPLSLKIFAFDFFGVLSL